jgi:hypothetical protein
VLRLAIGGVLAAVAKENAAKMPPTGGPQQVHDLRRHGIAHEGIIEVECHSFRS